MSTPRVWKGKEGWGGVWISVRARDQLVETNENNIAAVGSVHRGIPTVKVVQEGPEGSAAWGGSSWAGGLARRPAPFAPPDLWVGGHPGVLRGPWRGATTVAGSAARALGAAALGGLGIAESLHARHTESLHAEHGCKRASCAPRRRPAGSRDARTRVPPPRRPPPPGRRASSWEQSWISPAFQQRKLEPARSFLSSLLCVYLNRGRIRVKKLPSTSAVCSSVEKVGTNI